MNTEIKTDKNEKGKTGYSFDRLVKETEKVISDGCKLLKVAPPPMALIADDIGLGVMPIPTIEGMSNGQVLEKMGTALAHKGKGVKAVGFVCEAYVSKRTDIAPSADPKAKEVVFMAFEDENGRKEMHTFKHTKGVLKRVKGVEGTNFHGLTDEFWKGYKNPKAVPTAQPTLC